MKYLIKGEVGLKIGGEGTPFPELCNFHVGAVLTDESMALVFGHNSPPCLGASKTPRFLPAATQYNWR